MTIIQQITQKLDNALLKYGIISSHKRRVFVDEINDGAIAVNNDEYVVFRLVSNNPSVYGDGKAILNDIYVDVNLYYKDGYETAEAHLKEARAEMLTDSRCLLVNDIKPLQDEDGEYEGLNVEFVLYRGSNE